MSALRRTATLVGTTVAAGSLIVGTTTVPASAADRDFRYAGAKISFDVEKDDGKFEVEVDVDNAKPGSRWRIVLKQDGKRFLKNVYRADGDGDVDVDRDRRNTAGRDVFRLKIKRIGADKAATRVIRAR